MAEEKPTAATGIEVAERLATDESLRGRLVAIAHSRFRIEKEDAEDLLQEAAIVLLRSRQSVLSPEGFGYIVFHRCCCHFVERSVRRRNLVAEASPLEAPPSGGEAVSMDMAISLRQGIERLSPFCKGLLRAHYLEGLTYAEAARAFARAESGISTLVSRCLARLRRLMAAGTP